MKVLVTGGAGYIRSHAVRQLCDQGHSVIVVDDLSHGHRRAVDKRAELVELSTGATEELAKVLERFGIEAILHFAAFIEVAESVADPLRYYRNNVSNAISLIEAARASGVSRIVFSSTAAVYGNPNEI